MRGVMWLACALAAVPGGAQAPMRKAPVARSVSSGLPNGYNQVGETQLYCRQDYTLDFIGRFEDGYYYSSTFSDNGYRLALQVGTSGAAEVNCLSGASIDGVGCAVSVVPQGDLARVVYAVTNSNAEAVDVSLGVHADVMIGANDHAPISRKVDEAGNTYGLSLKDGGGAELCVLFGAGLAGVSAVDDFWFGYYYQNNSADEMVGNYTAGSNYMQENGSYDSGMGWCWKARRVEAGATVEFSYLIGVGDVTLEPSSTYEVTPDDPQGWNDLSRPHRLNLSGTYESPAGIEGFIEYAVEDGTEWFALTDTLQSGESFEASLAAMFTPGRSSHVIRFRATDAVGNTKLLPPIEYEDVAAYEVGGIAELTYTGDSLYQSGLTCTGEEGHYVIARYRNNVNAGTASFDLEGVFPHSIGKKTCTFVIQPAPLPEISFGEREFVYNGSPVVPEFWFAGGDRLEAGRDYEVVCSDNLYPGEATIRVDGRGNYAGSVSWQFTIDKAVLADSLYAVSLPDADISYDGASHGAGLRGAPEGMGAASFIYVGQGGQGESLEAPSAPGTYDVYLEIAEGTCYYGLARTYLGTFAIYQFDEGEWAVLERLHEELVRMGWSRPWDMSQGIRGVGGMDGLATRQGHVTGLDLSDANLSGVFPWTLLGLAQLESVDLSGNLLEGDVAGGLAATVAAGTAVPAGLRTLDLSDNGYEGNVGQLAAFFPSLQDLDVSGNCFSDVFPPIPAGVTTLDLGRQSIGRVLGLDLRDFSLESLAGSFPTILLYDHATRGYRQDIRILCTTEPGYDFGGSTGGWGIVIEYADGQVRFPYVSAQNEYHGESGDTLYVFDLNSGEYPEVSTLKATLSFGEGDANFNGTVDVTDLQAIILNIFDNYKDRPFNFTSADMVKDGVMNVQDVVGEVNLLLASDDAPESRLAAPAAGGGAACLYCRDGNLVLHAEEPVAAFDIVLQGVSSLEAADGMEGQGWVYATKKTPGGIHVVGYSLDGGYIPAGGAVLASFEGQGAQVVSAVLSDPQARKLGVALNAQPTGVSGAQAEEAGVAIENGNIILRTGKPMRDVTWTIVTMDGKLAGQGTLPSLEPGSHVIGTGLHGMVVVTVKAGGVKITKKINP